jgi:hypothetical protein
MSLQIAYMFVWIFVFQYQQGADSGNAMVGNPHSGYAAAGWLERQPTALMRVSLLELVSRCGEFEGKEVETIGLVEFDEHGSPLLCVLPLFVVRDHRNCFDLSVFEELGMAERGRMEAFLRRARVVALATHVVCRESLGETSAVTRGKLLDLRDLVNNESQERFMTEPKVGPVRPNGAG